MISATITSCSFNASARLTPTSHPPGTPRRELLLHHFLLQRQELLLYHTSLNTKATAYHTSINVVSILLPTLQSWALEKEKGSLLQVARLPLSDFTLATFRKLGEPHPTFHKVDEPSSTFRKLDEANPAFHQGQRLPPILVANHPSNRRIL